MVKNKTNDNKPKDLTDIVPESVIDDLFTSLTQGKGHEQQNTFYLYWLFGLPIKTCANKAGYAESYGYSLVEKYKKQPKLRHRVDEILGMFPEHYKSHCKLRLLQIAEIEQKALDEYEKKPRLVIDKPQLIKQVKQAAGVDLNENAPSPKTPTINIRELLLFHSGCMPELPEPEKIQDAEVISNGKDGE